MKRRMERTGEVRIGVSGWRYPPWRGVFYPPDLPQRGELAFAARRFSTLEINGSFYSLQRPEYYQRWYDETPAEFVFSVKGSRFITHMKRLREPQAALANFFASGVLALREKLGPFLWQLPRQFRFDRERLEAFFLELPRDTAAAARLARRHDARVEGRAWKESGGMRRLRHALEFRHDSFLTDECVELLRAHQIGLVVSDGGPHWPLREDLTADFVYVRLHGAEELYASGYTDEALDYWARRIGAWSRGTEPPDALRITADPSPRLRRDVYVYFDNDAKVHAPFNAEVLQRRLDSSRPAPPSGSLRKRGSRSVSQPLPPKRQVAARGKE